MNFWKEILLLLVGGVILYGVNALLKLTSNEISYVDKFVNVEKALISNQNLFSNDVKILVGKNEVQDISKVTLYLLNYSDKFFKDMELSIQFRKPSDNFKILNVSAAGENQQPNMVERVSEGEDGLYNYTVKSAKRTDSYDEFFQLVIYYEGKSDIKPDDFTVTIVNAEARVREFDRSHSPENTWNKVSNALLAFGLLCGTIIFAVVLFIVFAWLTRGTDKKFEQKYLKSMLEASENVSELNKLAPEDRNVMISDLLYEHRMQRWRKLNKFLRLLEGNTEPRRDTYDLHS